MAGWLLTSQAEPVYKTGTLSAEPTAPGMGVLVAVDGTEPHVRVCGLRAAARDDGLGLDNRLETISSTIAAHPTRADTARTMVRW